MSSITYAAHVRRAIEMLNKDKLYFGLGGLTPWTGEGEAGVTVTIPSTTPASSISDIFAYQKIVSKYLVYKVDTGGDITYKGYSFKKVDVADAYANDAYFLYLEASFNYDELPIKTYRQLGLYVDLVPSSGSTNNQVLLPYQVDSVGVLEYIMNFEAIARAADNIDTARVIIQY